MIATRCATSREYKKTLFIALVSKLAVAIITVLMAPCGVHGVRPANRLFQSR
jgi:hypothetical protein